MALLAAAARRPLRLVLLLACLASARPMLAQDRHVEDEVKAVFLFNFSKYVSWPTSAFPGGPTSPIRICLAAAPAFVEAVKSAVGGESIDRHPLIAMTPKTLDEARECHLLFVATSEAARMRPILDALRTLPILTVVDGSDFPDDGSVIGLVRDQNRVRFDVSRPAASQKGLLISAKLLRVARRVLEKN